MKLEATAHFIPEGNDLRTQRWVRFVLITAASLLLNVTSASAQEFRVLAIDSISASLESSTFSDRLERRWASSRPLLLDKEHGFTEMLHLTLGGSAYHPRLVKWSGDAEISFRQRFLSTARPGSDRSIYENLKEYKLYSTILKDRPASLSFFATRNVSDIDGDFLEAINVNRIAAGGNLAWVSGPLVHIADYTRTHYVSEGLIENDEIRKILRYDASFRVPRLYGDARYEYTDNNFLANDRSLISHTARLHGTKLFDDNGRRTITAALLYNRQQANVINEFVEASISTDIALSQSLKSAFSYSYRSNRTDTVSSHANAGKASIVHQLYKSLTTSVTGEGRFTTFDGGKQIDVTPSSSIDYRKQTFFGSINLFSGLSYRRFVDDLNRQVRRFVELELTYSGESAIFLTDQNIEIGTIELHNVSQPNQFPQEGIDFFIDTTGNFPEIIIAVTSSIVEGDKLKVNYLTTANESFEFEELSRSYGIGLNILSYVHFRGSRENSDRSLISGAPLNQLEDFRIDNLLLSLRYLKASIEGKYQRRQTPINPYIRRSILGRIVQPLSGKVNLVLSSSYVVTDFTDMDESLRVMYFSGSLWYRPQRNLTLESRISNINRSGRRDDGHNFVSRNSIRYSVHKIQVELLLNMYDRNVTVVGTESRTIFKLLVKRAL